MDFFQWVNWSIFVAVIEFKMHSNIHSHSFQSIICDIISFSHSKFLHLCTSLYIFNLPLNSEILTFKLRIKFFKFKRALCKMQGNRSWVSFYTIFFSIEIGMVCRKRKNWSYCGRFHPGLFDKWSCGEDNQYLRK